MHCTYLITYNEYCDILSDVECFGMISLYFILFIKTIVYYSYIYDFQFQKILIHLAKDYVMFYLQILFRVLNLEGTSRRLHLDPSNVFYAQKSLSYFVVLK